MNEFTACKLRSKGELIQIVENGDGEKEEGEMGWKVGPTLWADPPFLPHFPGSPLLGL